MSARVSWTLRRKCLLVVEALVYFGPVAFLWLLGVLVFVDPSDFIGRTPTLGALAIAGAVGLAALVYVVVALLREREALRFRRLTWVAITIGALPLLIFGLPVTVDSLSRGVDPMVIAVFGLPLFGTVRIARLAWHLLRAPPETDAAHD